MSSESNSESNSESTAMSEKIGMDLRENFFLGKKSFIEHLDFNNRFKNGIEDNNSKICCR